MVEKDECQVDAPNQSESWRKIALTDIPSGATVPLEKLISYMPPPSSVIDFGGGVGNKDKELKNIGYQVSLLDINENAIRTALEQNSILGAAVDVTNKQAVLSSLDRLFFGYFHPVDGVIMEALLCNLVDMKDPDKWRNAIQIASNVVHQDDGMLFIADVLRSDHNNPYFDKILNFKGWSPPKEEFINWKKAWEQRYANNRELGLPDGVFIVAKPGVNKGLEYKDPKQLEKLWRSSDFERLAKHFTVSELIDELAKNHFVLLEMDYRIWRSRSGMPLSGIVIVAKRTYSKT